MEDKLKALIEEWEKKRDKNQRDLDTSTNSSVQLKASYKLRVILKHIKELKKILNNE